METIIVIAVLSTLSILLVISLIIANFASSLLAWATFNQGVTGLNPVRPASYLGIGGGVIVVNSATFASGRA